MKRALCDLGILSLVLDIAYDESRLGSIGIFLLCSAWGIFLFEEGFKIKARKEASDKQNKA